MSQKLSAMTYIRNNKRRVSVLIVSLALCFVLVYLTNFLLSSTVESFRPLLLKNTLKCQFISLPGSAYGLNDELDDEQYAALYKQKTLELVEELKGQEGIEYAFYVDIIYCPIEPAIGGTSYEIPCTDKENIPVFMEHFNAVLKEGRLPENPGEVVLDEASMINNDFELGGYFYEDSYEEYFTIVGVLDCNTYFGCATASATSFAQMICTLSDGSIKDMSALLHDLGYAFDKSTSAVVDYSWGEAWLKTQVVNVLKNSTQLIYITIMILLSISLYIVYTMYLRDRRNEWCLFRSIGFSQTSIYFSILRELTFTFVAAIAIGGVIISLSVAALDYMLIIPLGLKCRYFYPQTLGEIFCSYVLLFGLLQIPVRYALYKIRTIDAIEDDLY